MKSIKIKYIVLVLLIALSSCRKDERIEGPVVNEPIGDPTIEVISGVTGLVTDENGDPVNNASVSIYNRQVKSDENGVFYVNNVGLNKFGSVVHVEKPGYFDGYKTFIPALGKKSYVAIRMVERGQADKFKTSDGGVINVEGGAEVSIPADGIVEKNGGASYDGEVLAYTHWFDPLDDDVGLEMPGNLTALRSDNSEAQLKTYGMIAVELESSNGTPLQLAANTKAQLKFPVPNSLDPPSTIPLWYFDEVDGVWLEEGQATLVNGHYEGEVSHFSFWNCDDPYDLIELEGRLLFADQPLANYAVRITLENGEVGFGYTDNEGFFRGKVPKDELLTLTVRHCDENVVNEEIGPFDMDHDLGDLDVSLLGFHSVVQGILHDCFDQPAPDAYGLLREGDKVVQIITPIADGSFNTVVSGCSNKNYSVQFYDPVNLKNTDIIDISEDFEFNDLMEIRICDDLDEFIQYAVDGVSAPLITEADVVISNGDKLIIRGGEPNSFESFDMDIFATTIGQYNPSSMAIQGSVGPANPELAMMCGDHLANFVTCDQFDVEILSFNTYVTGTFSGILVANKDTISGGIAEFDEYSVSGQFRLKVDDNITTGEISGQFWFDDNANNMREDDEDNSMPTQYVRLQRTDGNASNLFPNYMYAYGRQYKFTNVPPGTYEVSVFYNNGYDLVDKDVGSDDRDSDFDYGPQQFVTDEMTIVSDEVFENVDCGFEIPTNVNCYTLSSYGCAPEIIVSAGINGGVPPYTATLNGTQTMETETTAFFEVSEGGVYFIEVEDAVGNKCSTEGSVKDYNNLIQGRVWRDIEGGTPNEYDSGDFLQGNILIAVHDLSGSIVAATQSNSNGWYSIQNVPPGPHFVIVDVPGNLTLLEQNTSSMNGSDIDPTTGNSDEFIVEDCYDVIRIDVGLKSN